MPTYVITAPDGKEYEIDAPSGATQDDALKYFQSNWKPEAPKQEVKPTDRREVYAETAEEMPWYQQMAAGAGGAAQGMYLGAKQLLGKASDEEVKDYQQAMSGLRGTGGGIVGEIFANMIPGIYGFKAASAIPAVARGLAGSRVAAMGTTAGVGGALGAAESALAPVTEDQSRLANAAMGGTIGLVAPVATYGAVRTGQAIKNELAPLVSRQARQVAGGRMLRDVAGAKADDVVAALRSSQPIISQPTAGQAAVGAVSPEFAAMQRIASDIDPAGPYAAELARRGAREAEIRSFAGTTDDLEKAIASRKSNADANYAKAFQSAVKGDSELGAILRNPYVKDTLPSIRKLVQARQARGETVSLSEQLQMMKKELDAVIAGTPMNKPSDNAAREVMAIQGKLTDWMKDKVPGYRQAIEQFAAESGPINQMKIGQAAIEKLGRPLGDKETPAQYARALANEMQLTKVTGQSRKELSEQLSPENMNKLNRVVQELDIDARFQEQASAGLRSESVRSAVGDIIEIPNMLNQAVTLTNGVLRRLGSASKIKTLKELSVTMQDPAMTAKMMEAASEKEKNAIKFLLNANKAGAIVGTSVNRSYQ